MLYGFLNYFELFIFKFLFFAWNWGRGQKPPSPPRLCRPWHHLLVKNSWKCYQLSVLFLLFVLGCEGWNCLCKLCHYFPVAIHDSGSSSQKVTSTGRSACDLKEKLDCFKKIQQGKYIIVHNGWIVEDDYLNVNYLIECFVKLTWYVVHTLTCNFSPSQITKSPVLEFICKVFLSVCFCISFPFFFLCNLIMSLFKVLSCLY